MATYVIGDVQGCYRELQLLLEKIAFNSDHDQLGFVGDLVNRGPDSLAVLRFIKNLPQPLVVLGNHDLYLLILGYGLMPRDRYAHTLDNILDANDKLDLLDWLRHQALVKITDDLQQEQALLVHAGIPPQWSWEQAIDYADEVHQRLRGEHFTDFLGDLFGNNPSEWQPQLTGQARLRYITNALTRMRYCTAQGTLWLAKNTPADPAYQAWFHWPSQTVHKPSPIKKLLFGHWAALNGRCDAPQHVALDTGCVWGNRLTALCLETNLLTSVKKAST